MIRLGIKSTVERATGKLTQRIKYIKVGGRNLGDFLTVSVSGIIPVLYLMVIFFYSGGVVNALLEGSRSSLAGIPIVPGRNAQSPTEGVLNAFMLAVGTAGVYLMYKGGRQAIRGRLGNSYIIGGIAMLLLSFLLGMTLLSLKGFR
ncbi:MAG: hypothetical protein FJ358_00915 [Thaumarchaeota archaeon]|nr:hypothetical protein [Nitrososphaerota archaeon]